jgi:hypothetical protein
MKCLFILTALWLLGCQETDEKVLSQIRAAGADAFPASSGPFGPQQIYVEIKGELGDKELQRVAPHLKKLRKVTGLHMHDSAVTDAGLEHLRDLNNIEHIVLENTAITDAGLEHLKHMQNLTYLSLTGTKVSDEGIASLRRALPKLEIEKLSPALAKAENAIHDAGGQTTRDGGSLVEVSFRLSHLGRDHRLNDAELKDLRPSLEAWKASIKRLDLSDTAITDEALQHLEGLSNLEELVLTGTKVTADGADAFAKDRPGVKIKR